MRSSATQHTRRLREYFSNANTFLSPTLVTRADYWRTYDGQGEIGNLLAMTAQDVKNMEPDPVLLELGIKSRNVASDHAGGFSMAGHKYDWRTDAGHQSLCQQANMITGKHGPFHGTSYWRKGAACG